MRRHEYLSGVAGQTEDREGHRLDEPWDSG